MSHDGHERVEHACGHVVRQCRCMSPDKKVTTLAHPCASCAAKGWPGKPAEAQPNALPDGPERELRDEEMRLANVLLYAVKDVGMRDKRGRLEAWRDAIEHVKVQYAKLEALDRLHDEDEAEKAKLEELDVVFDGPPGPEGGRFVEVENRVGRSVKAGEWIERRDGYWVLRLTVKLP